MDAAGFLPGADERVGGSLVHRRVAAAFEVALASPGRGQHLQGGGDMAGLGVVGRAGQRQLGAAEAVAIGGAGFDQRQGLDRFHRRAREDAALDVADGDAALAVGIDDGDGAAMAAFDERSAGDFDEDGVGHRPSHFSSRAMASSRISSRLEKQKRRKVFGASAL